MSDWKDKEISMLENKFMAAKNRIIELEIDISLIRRVLLHTTEQAQGLSIELAEKNQRISDLEEYVEEYRRSEKEDNADE